MLDVGELLNGFLLLLPEVPFYYVERPQSKFLWGRLQKQNQSVFQCQPTALLRASGSTQGGYMALSVVYFGITHRLGRPHYVWDDYLYSVREKVEVGGDCKCNCLCSVIVLRGMMMMMKGREKVKPGAGS